MDPSCFVCGNPVGSPIYESGAGKSLTSLCRTYPGETRVFFCHACGHLQTSAMEDVAGYYATDYDILVDSEEEDQVYEIRGGKAVYRTDHQVRLMLDKLDFPDGTRLLDYGCAKSSTIRSLCEIEPGIVPHAFDVSARYVPFWEKFIDPANWAINVIPQEWVSRFDVVTSFFSLEHIPAVADAMAAITRVLRPGGKFYGVVPNVLGNTADFIVVDHCNHFTTPSLLHLFAAAGLRIREIDTESHRGAFVIVADRPTGGQPATMALPSTDEIARTAAELERTAGYWIDAETRIRAFEATLAKSEPVAIYGAGFYGAFIAASLVNPDRVTCHLDQNPFLSGKAFNGLPIIRPDELSADVSILLVGLNPAHARAIIADVPALAERPLHYFFL